MFRWTVALLVCLLLLGCAGGTDPINKGKDKPAPSTKEKDKTTPTG